nr:dihydroxy-acid dehydratase [Nonomuraea lactucae]
MSGTASGTVVLHVAPEAAAGGPLSLVRDGDPILLDVTAGRLTCSSTTRNCVGERRTALPRRPSRAGVTAACTSGT